MAILTDFEITTGKDIRYVGTTHGASGAGYYTVLEFHRWLQDLADDAAASGDDFLDITSETPSDKKFDTIIELINGYNINQETSEHLYGGSIIQSGSDEIWDGIQIIANEGCNIQIQQNGALLANDFWNSIPDGETLSGLNRDVANGIAAQFMIKVRTSGADIDGRRLLTQTREWGKTYSEFKINGTGRGVNVAALTFADDGNNLTNISAVAGWTEISNINEGYSLTDVDNDGLDEAYYGLWDKDTYSINQFYERMKWITIKDASVDLYGLDGDVFRGVTNEISLSTPRSGTFNSYEPISWSTGTGQMLAIDSSTAGTKMWIQLLTGSSPTSGLITGGSSSATATATGSLDRVISTPFCGNSTGSALTGSYGFTLEVSDLTASDKIIALDNTQRTPPNYVLFSVGNLVADSGEEDSVIVGPKDVGNAIQFDQLTLDTSLNGAGETSVVVTAAIPSDTPASGTIRVQTDGGRYRRLVYTSWTGSTFTVTSANFTSDIATAGNNLFISYIDKTASSTSETFTSIYSTDRSLWIRVRNAGSTPIKTFETAGTLGSAGGSATVVRTSDI